MAKDPAGHTRMAKIILGLGISIAVLSMAFWATNFFAMYGIVGQTCSESTVACSQGQKSAQQKLHKTAANRDLAQGGILAGILIFGLGAVGLAKAEGRLPKSTHN